MGVTLSGIVRKRPFLHVMWVYFLALFTKTLLSCDPLLKGSRVKVILTTRDESGKEIPDGYQLPLFTRGDQISMRVTVAGEFEIKDFLAHFGMKKEGIICRAFREVFRVRPTISGARLMWVSQ